MNINFTALFTGTIVIWIDIERVNISVVVREAMIYNSTVQ